MTFDLQGARPGHPISDAARHVPAWQGDAGETAFYVDLFKKLAQTAEYKDYMEKQALKPIFLTGKDMVKFFGRGRRAEQESHDRAGFVAH